MKPEEQVWLKKPAIKLCNKKSLGLYMNCKATICENTDSKSQLSGKYMYSDKNCQEIKRPRKPRNVMQSVTNTDVMDVWLPKPVPNEYRRVSSDKNCQSTRCYSIKKIVQ